MEYNPRGAERLYHFSRFSGIWATLLKNTLHCIADLIRSSASWEQKKTTMITAHLKHTGAMTSEII